MKIFDQDSFTFDDVLLKPQYSNIFSRADVNLGTNIGKIQLANPFISANMSTVTESAMMLEMANFGGLGILHRFMSDADIQHNVKITRMNNLKAPIVISIGVDHPPKTLDLINTLCESNLLSGVCIDVAHGHHAKVKNIIPQIIVHFPQLTIIAGNVATYDGAMFLADNGANVIKINVGAGALCTTRLVTGHGVPQLSAIIDAVKVKNAHPHISIIADGGMKNSGDIAKAIAAGADAIMTGSLLAGTDECPGKIRVQPDGKYVKDYQGMASYDAQKSAGRTARSIEGIAIQTPLRGPARPILEGLAWGLRSALSYSGAHNLKEFQDKAIFIRVSSNSLLENHPHALRK